MGVAEEDLSELKQKLEYCQPNAPTDESQEDADLRVKYLQESARLQGDESLQGATCYV